MTKPTLLKSPQFIAGALLLIVNDFFLKGYYHNWLTGKISDVVGLYIFPLFLISLFPQWRKLSVYFVTAIVFVLWKSSYAQPFIDLFHYINIPLNRTVDITDNIALLALPLSYKYATNSRIQIFSGINTTSIALLSLIIFCSDSLPSYMMIRPQSQYPYCRKVRSKKTAPAIMHTLDSMHLTYYTDSVNGYHTYKYSRLKNYNYMSDTIPNINFVFLPGGLYVISYDINSITADSNGALYRSQKRKYNKLIKHQFRKLIK